MSGTHNESNFAVFSRRDSKHDTQLVFLNSSLALCVASWGEWRRAININVKMTKFFILV